MGESKILLEEWSPVCNIQAFVERTDTSCYFYLWVKPGIEDAVVKSCWICNVSAAPGELDVESMRRGIAPAMPEQYVLHDAGGMELDADKLKIVWFEEGNAAALLSEEELLCVIPCWSGYQGFHGYSRYADGMAPCAFPPKALVRGTRDGVVYGITAGVSLIPMPGIELYDSQDYRTDRRMELGFAAVKQQEGLCGWR